MECAPDLTRSRSGAVQAASSLLMAYFAKLESVERPSPSPSKLSTQSMWRIGAARRCLQADVQSLSERGQVLLQVQGTISKDALPQERFESCTTEAQEEPWQAFAIAMSAVMPYSLQHTCSCRYGLNSTSGLAARFLDQSSILSGKACSTWHLQAPSFFCECVNAGLDLRPGLWTSLAASGASA